MVKNEIVVWCVCVRVDDKAQFGVFTIAPRVDLVGYFAPGQPIVTAYDHTVVWVEVRRLGHEVGYGNGDHMILSDGFGSLAERKGQGDTFRIGLAIVHEGRCLAAVKRSFGGPAHFFGSRAVVARQVQGLDIAPVLSVAFGRFQGDK